jgi:ribosomal-protein-alanine N-acetyltransferase
MDNNVYCETERLTLCRYNENDLLDSYEYLSDPEVVKFEPYSVMSMEEVKENLIWRISTDEMIAIVLKENQKMIGNIYLGKRDFETLEIGYVLNQKYWGKGYAKEACSALVERSFSSGIHRIVGECDPQNPSSWKLLEALRFEREGHLIQNVYFWKDNVGNPIWKDTYVYSKLSW